MTDVKLNELYIEAEKLARQSYRVIAIASKDTDIGSLRRVSGEYCELTLEGFLALREPMLPEAAKNVLRARNGGLKIIMLSPDESENNAVVAESLGIASSPDNMITGRALAGMKEGLFRLNLDKYTVYQGLNLSQKRLLVRFLQEKGEKVGYLCSELDEIILMKEADVGFSSSVTISDRAGGSGVDLSRHNIPIFSKSAGAQRRGCEALKFVSDVIVSEPDVTGTGGFNAIVDAVLCSKSVYYNLHRMLKYMISTQVARLLLVFASVFLGFTALEPAQILFLGLVTDFAAIIIIALEKPDYSLLKAPSSVGEKLLKPFFKNPEATLFGILLASGVAVGAVLLKKYGLIADNAITSFCFISFLAAQIALLNECKREQSIFDKNVRINGAYVMMLITVIGFVLLCAIVPSVALLFGVAPLGKYAALSTLAPAIVVTAAYELFKAASGYGVKKKKVGVKKKR
jgi:Ca2+-transporting ATPase